MRLPRFQGDLGVAKNIDLWTVAERQAPDMDARCVVWRNGLLQALPIACETAATPRQLRTVPAARLRPIVGQYDVEPAGSEIVDGLGTIARIELFECCVDGDRTVRRD